MKKTIILSSMICALMLAVSCANGNNDPTCGNFDGKLYVQKEATKIRGNEVVFDIFADSTNAEGTRITLNYTRSKYGAKECVQLRNIDYSIEVNGRKIENLPTVLDFYLSEWGSAFSGTDVKPITDKNDIVNYDSSFSINTKLKINDVVTFRFNEASVYGEGAETALLDTMHVVLLDVAKEVNSYKQIATPMYFPFIDSVNRPTAKDKKNEVEYQFNNGHLYIKSDSMSSDNSHPVSGDTMTIKKLSVTYDGVTKTIDEIINEEVESLKKEGKSDEEIEKIKNNYYSQKTSTFKFKEEGDMLIFYI